MSAEAYSEFFKALHDVEPFPWQRRLATRVLAGGGWPSMIALPTSAGKTSVIEIAVFGLAMSDPHLRQARRVFFVVDRRIVVDAAYERAKTLAWRLQEALGGSPSIVREVAERLLALGGEVPLQVASLRGGVYRDHAWARLPEQPLVCVSTVDQVGSRLLFRGYGLGTGETNMLPVHAGLVGNDALIVLDEAHISRPFEETLEAVARYRTWAESPIETPWSVVRMSATPDPSVADVLMDELEDRTHCVLGPRLSASKLAELLEIPADRSIADALAEKAQQLLAQDGEVRVVGVITNRVSNARETFKRLDALEGSDAVLLIGRSRPLDRDRLLDAYLPRMSAGRKRSTEDRILFVVSTQCIEVGADLDFDALVTECASLDALRQRFGRLDRLGERRTTRAVIVARKDQTAAKATDPIYGSGFAATWRWLEEQLPGGKHVAKVLDFGITALEHRLPSGDELAALSAPRRHAPVVLPAYVDRWAQTSPLPRPDPDVSLFLHGPDTGPADIQLVWRCDLSEDDQTSWPGIVALVPPSSAECLSLPFLVARDWLSGRTPRPVSDVETETADATEETGDGGSAERHALRWRGAHDAGTKIVSPWEIRPGDTLVVPATYGNADRYGWAPEATEAVDDLAEQASIAQRLRAVVRLHPATVFRMVPHRRELLQGLEELMEALDAEEDVEPLENVLLEVIAKDEAALGWARTSARALLDDRRRRRVPYPNRTGVALVGSRRLSLGRLDAAFDEITDEDDASSLTRPTALAEHTTGVRKRVGRMGRHCGLPEDLVTLLDLVAELHDLGKADPRFQVMLHAGDEVAAAGAPELLAKSGLNPRNRQAFQLSWERSGLPPGFRHEALSVALAMSDPDAINGPAGDRDLALHLIAGHHGCARPFFPPQDDQDPRVVSAPFGESTLEAATDHRLARVDSSVSDRFWRSTRRYGWWGLAYLEAILRLADHRQSEAEAEEQE